MTMAIANRYGPRPRTLLIALFAAISLSACGADDEDGDRTSGTSDTSTPTPSPTSGEPADSGSGGTPIRITFGDGELTGRLDDSATARDLDAQLPLSLSLRDHNNVEKTAPLPRKLSLDGAPDGHDPAAGDIGYWAPGGDLVFYHDDDAPFFNGIVRIGELDGDVEAVRRLLATESVTIERAK